jgi:DNA-binding response OmpR family regulator
MNILVVEDEPVASAVLVKILSARPGTQVTTADTGDAAWARLDDPGRFFDLVFLDISLPGVDGLELLRRIRNSALHTRTQVVMCTAASDRDTVTKAIALGVKHYLVKPLSEAAVLAKLAALTPPAAAGPSRQLAGV